MKENENKFIKQLKTASLERRNEIIKIIEKLLDEKGGK